MDTIDHLSYTIAPSFEEGSKITIVWNPGSREYELSVKEGVTEREFVASPERADGLARFLQGLSLPPQVEGSFGLDGTTYTLEIGHRWARTTYSWWVKLPPAWSAFRTLVDLLNDLARSHLECECRD